MPLRVVNGQAWRMRRGQPAVACSSLRQRGAMQWKIGPLGYAGLSAKPKASSNVGILKRKGGVSGRKGGYV
jgi:hypothetical protein